MIIFYNKKTGKIVGTVDGRIHTKEHLGMWIGSREENERLITEWKPVRFYTDKGKLLSGFTKECLGACDSNGSLLVYTSDFEPVHPQKELFVELDKKPTNIYKYKVNLKTKKLEKRG